MLVSAAEKDTAWGRRAEGENRGKVAVLNKMSGKKGKGLAKEQNKWPTDMDDRVGTDRGSGAGEGTGESWESCRRTTINR